MAWIESHQELGRHPKTKKLARLLGASCATTVGHLHFLWWWALDFAQDGDLSRYDAQEIAEGACWDGEGDRGADFFLDQLIGAGFVDKDGDRLTLHDWDEYAGRLIERRKKDRERKRVARSADDDGSGTTSDGLPTETDGHLEPQYPTEPDQTKTTAKNKSGDNTTTPAAAADDRFARFWAAYPKKVGKKNTLAVWKRLKVDDDLFDIIMKALNAQKQSSQWQRDDGKYIPNPQSWLNGQRWEDEIAPPKQGGSNGSEQQRTTTLSGFHVATDEE